VNFGLEKIVLEGLTVLRNTSVRISGHRAEDVKLFADGIICLLCDRMETLGSSVNKNQVCSVCYAAQCNRILNNKIRSCIVKQCNTKPFISPVLCEKKSLKTAVSRHKE
jgi:hypothetical protein